jgi:hypothetical protein
MERFILEYKIPLDIWRELKTYLVHNIKTQAKHMKNEKSIINFNDALRNLPRIKPPRNGPRIVYNSAKKSYRMAKYIYHIQAFKPGTFDAAEPYHDGKLTIIAYCELRNYRHYHHIHDYNKHFVNCAVPFRQTSLQDTLLI